MNQDTQRPDLEARIVRAFFAVQRDESLTLHEAQLADQSLRRMIPSEEFEIERSRDSVTRWQDIPPDHLDECDAALSHLSPEGWRFYIPAYMLRAIALLREPIWNTWLPGGVVFSLNIDTENRGLAAYKVERFKTLDECQIHAIGEFLRFVATEASEDAAVSEDAQQALKRYWALPAEKRPTYSIEQVLTGRLPRRTN